MFTFLLILLVIVGVKLVLIAAVVPKPSEVGVFELERRTEAGDHRVINELRRERLLPDIVSLQRIVVSVLLVAAVALSIVAFGWFIGLIVAVVIALEYGAVARVASIRSYANKWYEKYEAELLRFVEKGARVFTFLRTAVPEPILPRLHSKQELAHLVSESSGILSPDDKKMIINGLEADTRQVKEIMTPRSVIDSIARKEHLGPLVLDDLHKTGHSRFPVIEGDIDHVVGVLHIRDLLTIDAKRKSTSVEKAMDPRVFYIKENQTLQHALAAFLKTHHHLFVVVNEFRETVGLLSLEDVIEAWLGRKIIDEFDAHEDLRVVAGRNPRGNNHSDTSTDV